MDIPKDGTTISVKDMVIIRLKEMIDRAEGADKCTICEAIHQLEQPADNGWNGSMWMILTFMLIFGGFGNNSNLFDLETISKVLNDSIAKSKTSNEEDA